MPGEGGRCEGRPSSPVLAQLQDQRKSLESATETSVVSPMGGANTSGATDSRQDKGAAFAPGGGKEEVTSYRGIVIRWAHQLPGKPAEGHAPHSPADKNNHQLGSGVSTWEGQSREWVWVKQALVGQGTCRGQEESHLE